MAGFSFSHDPKKVETIESKYRKIVTPIPVPESLPILEEMYKYESHSMHGQLPMVWDYAEDFSNWRCLGKSMDRFYKHYICC